MCFFLNKLPKELHLKDNTPKADRQNVYNALVTKHKPTNVQATVMSANKSLYLLFPKIVKYYGSLKRTYPNKKTCPGKN